MPRIRSETSAGTLFAGWAPWLVAPVAALFLTWSAGQWLEGRLEIKAGGTGGTRTNGPDTGPPIARLEIARLGVAAEIEAGLEVQTPRRGIGLSPYGARPGEAGNLILMTLGATYFTRLQGANAGDLIRLETREGRTFHYRVFRQFMVSPADRSALRTPQNGNLLTLITCPPNRSGTGDPPACLAIQAEPTGKTVRNVLI